MVNRFRGFYCKCWEKKIPSLRGTSSVEARTYGGSIEKFSDSFPWADTDLTTEEIAKKLVDAGLEQHEVDLVVARFIEQLPLKEIVQVQGWTSEGSVKHFLKKALVHLRKVNFKL